ncbi:hypothetical protein DPX16_15405 [Anabarilius grahami]|uniref:Uncharacterized protein n=1 Tax=Anabarilius grahami TaxID=495550 RepID=A0A3N0XVZ0_ANAGA|nr:hypothetical protein DPX16_15405 [Anabarilius grahami]
MMIGKDCDPLSLSPLVGCKPAIVVAAQIINHLRHPCQFKTQAGYEKREKQGQQNPHNVTRQNDVPFIAVVHVILPSVCSLVTTPQTSSDAEISHKAHWRDSTNDSGEAEWEELSCCMTALSQSRLS